MKPFASLGAIALLPLAACQTLPVDQPWPSHPASHLTAGEQRRVILFTSGWAPDAERVRAVEEAIARAFRAAPTALPDQGMESALATMREACSVTTPTVQPQSGFVAAAAAALLPQVISLAQSALKAQVAAWAESFEASWSARQTGQFYQSPPAGGRRRGDIPPLRYRCLAVERTVDDGGNQRGAFLHIAQIAASDDGTALRFLPLVQAHSATKARVGNTGAFNAAMVVTIESVSLDARRGITAASGTAFTASFDLGAGRLGTTPPRVFANQPDRQAAGSDWFPYVPLSRGANGEAIGSGPFTLTATVAETAGARDLAGAIARQADTVVDQIAAEAARRVAAATAER